MEKPYNEFIRSLVPGLNQIIVHLAYDNEEMQAVTIEHPEFGSAWRQRDFNYITNEEFKTELKRNKVQLVTWREIQNVRN
jgi:chitin disaccharide deacetylase